MENEKLLDNEKTTEKTTEKTLVTDSTLTNSLGEIIESKSLEEADVKEIKKAIIEATQQINKNNVLLAEKLAEQVEIILKKNQDSDEKPLTDSSTLKEQPEDIQEKYVESSNTSLNNSFTINETEKEQQDVLSEDDNNEITFKSNTTEKRKKKSIKSYINRHSDIKKENIVIKENPSSKLIIDESNESTENKISQQTENHIESSDETTHEPIGGVYGLEDEKPLTGSFTLKEQPEDIQEKDVESLNVPLNGSFGIEAPADEVIAEPVVETVVQADTIEDTTVPEVEPVAETETETESESVINEPTEVTDEQPVVDEPISESTDETTQEPIGGVYGLEDEKPLTGSFTLKEQPEDIQEKDVESLNVPLNGSFAIEAPADEVIAEPVVETVAQDDTPVQEVETVTETESAISEPTEVTAEQPIVDEPISESTDETTHKPIGGVYGLEDEKPLTGSFTLKEQPEDIQEKDVESLNVPLNGSFAIETSADEVIAEPVVETVAQADTIENTTVPEVEPVAETIEETPAISEPTEVTAEQTVVDEPTSESTDETTHEPIGGIYGLEDEKPLTGSFTLKEQPEDIQEKDVESLNVPLNGSFEIEAPTDEVIAEPVVETVAQADTIADTTVPEVVEHIVEDEPVVIDVTEITEENSAISEPTEVIAKPVVDEPIYESTDEATHEPIGGVYGLEDEKPLTGSFTLKEQPEDIQEKDVESLNVPLNGSFAIEAPADEVIAEPVVETVAQADTPVQEVETVTETESAINEPTEVTAEQTVVDEPTSESIDETPHEPIGGVYGLEDEKPLTGSFTLKEQPEDIQEKDVDSLNVPLNGSFAIEAPADEVIAEPVVETVAQADTIADTTAPEVVEHIVEDEPVVIDVTEITEETSEISEPTEVIAEQSVVDEPISESTDETTHEPIGGVYGLEDEKPLTGSFTLKEQPEDIQEKDVESLNVPLNGSFAIEAPADEVIAEPVVETVAQDDTVADTTVPEVEPVSETETAISEPTEVTDEQPVVDEPISESTDETTHEPIGGVYGLEDEKPLTGSFTLKEQPEDIQEKDVESLNVPLNGSFAIEAPADEVIAEPVVETVAQADTIADTTVPEVEPVAETIEETPEISEPTEVTAEQPVVENEITSESIDETPHEPIGGVYGLEDEKPLTGSFTLKEQPEDIQEKDVDSLNVPLNGSFAIEAPADEVIAEPVVETVAQADTIADTTVPEVEPVAETIEETPEISEPTEVTAEQPVVENEITSESIDETPHEPIGGVYGLEDEKPLTGSFTLKEQPEDIQEKDVESLNVPLNGSFAIEAPADEVIAEPVVETVAQADTIADTTVPEVKPVAETIEETSEISEPTEVTAEQPVVENEITSESTDETTHEPIGGVYGLEDEKPLTGSFTLKEQPEDIQEKDVESLNVPLNGSFEIEAPADEVIAEPVVETVVETVAQADTIADTTVPEVEPVAETELATEITEETFAISEPTEVTAEQPVVNETTEKISEVLSEPTVETETIVEETSENSDSVEEILEQPIDKPIEQPVTKTSSSKQDTDNTEENSGLKDLVNQMQSTIYNISTPAEPTSFESLQSADDEKFDLQKITEAILKAAESSNKDENLSSEKFAEQVRNILENKENK